MEAPNTTQFDSQFEILLNRKLDLTDGLAQGDVFYVDSRGNFKRLAPGTSGQVLKTNGANANPSWGTAPLPTDLNISGQQQGDIIYFNGSNWVRLGTSVAGYGLRTNASNQAPVWSADVAGRQYTQADTSVSNDNTDTTVASLSIPAMAANDALVVELQFENPGGNFQPNDIWALKAGSSDILRETGTTPQGSVYTTIQVGNRNSTSSQIVVAKGQLIDSASWVRTRATTSIDLSATFTLTLIVKIPVANLAKTVRVNYINAIVLRG